jgi:hypothetical protein
VSILTPTWCAHTITHEFTDYMRPQTTAPTLLTKCASYTDAIIHAEKTPDPPATSESSGGPHVFPPLRVPTRRPWESLAQRIRRDSGRQKSLQGTLTSIISLYPDIRLILLRSLCFEESKKQNPQENETLLENTARKREEGIYYRYSKAYVV